jgi:hypothetical protein
MRVSTPPNIDTQGTCIHQQGPPLL